MGNKMYQNPPVEHSRIRVNPPPETWYWDRWEAGGIPFAELGLPATVRWTQEGDPVGTRHVYRLAWSDLRPRISESVVVDIVWLRPDGDRRATLTVAPYEDGLDLHFERHASDRWSDDGTVDDRFVSYGKMGFGRGLCCLRCGRPVGVLWACSRALWQCQACIELPERLTTHRAQFTLSQRVRESVSRLAAREGLPVGHPEVQEFLRGELRRAELRRRNGDRSGGI